MSDDPQSEAARLVSEANELMRKGDPDEAMRRLRFALDALGKDPEPRAQAAVLESIGSVQRATGKLAEAETSVRAALACWLKIGDRAEEARLLGSVATLRLLRGDLEDAEYWLNSSLNVLVEVGAQAGEAEVRRSLATLHLRKGSLERARAEAFEAIRIFRDLGDGKGEARVQVAAAQICMRQGDFEGAYTAVDRGLELFAPGDASGMSTMRAIRAAALRREGRHAEAEQELLIAVEQKRAIKDRSGEAGVLNTLGSVIMDLGRARLTEAERHFLRSIELFQQMNDTQNVANTLSNLALVYRQLDRDNDSEVVLNDALKIYRRAGAPEPIASTIGTLAAYKAAAGNIPEAVAMFDEAFNMVRSFAPADLPLTFLLHRLDLMLQRGELPAARAFVDECFSGASPSPLQRLRFVLPARVRIALYEHDVAAARATFQEAMDLLQQEPEHAHATHGAELELVRPALQAAETSKDWPLYNGYRPAELSPALRRAVIDELSAARPHDYKRLQTHTPQLWEAMTAE